MANYTSTQLADLRKAIASGATSITTATGTVTYRNLAEMRELERLMAIELGEIIDATTRRYSRAEFYRE